jgi:hypothetical protein
MFFPFGPELSAFFLIHVLPFFPDFPTAAKSGPTSETVTGTKIAKQNPA